jgi:hypothetical protein
MEKREAGRTPPCRAVTRGAFGARILQPARQRVPRGARFIRNEMYELRNRPVRIVRAAVGRGTSAKRPAATQVGSFGTCRPQRGTTQCCRGPEAFCCNERRGEAGLAAHALSREARGNPRIGRRPGASQEALGCVVPTLHQGGALAGRPAQRSINVYLGCGPSGGPSAQWQAR